MVEFNLSGKIRGKLLAKGQPKECAGELILYLRDVKEFIRLLKERITGTEYYGISVEDVDKLAGDKLI